MNTIRPTILPLGDRALLVRFGTRLDDEANLAAVAFAHRLQNALPPGVSEIVASLVSVAIHYDPARIGFEQLAGELRLHLGRPGAHVREDAPAHAIKVRYGGEDGPDLAEVASLLGMSSDAFISEHSNSRLRVLATGFAPGFVYCGMHKDNMNLPRRTSVRPQVPAGSVLFAARQTAIAATSLPTGWHVIGRTDLRNFDPALEPPTRLSAGDEVLIEADR